METVHSTETVVTTKLHGVASRKTLIESVNTPVHTVRGPYGHVHLFPSESKKFYGGNSILERPVTEQVGSSGNPPRYLYQRGAHFHSRLGTCCPDSEF